MGAGQNVSGAPEISPRYRPDIDGLRAIAVTSVVAFHAGVPPFRSGFVGVDVFFVISGFLIGGIILQGGRSGGFSFGGFYARRARRILPALVCVLIATALLGAVILDGAEFRKLGLTSAATILGASNVLFWKDVNYFTPDARLNPLLMTWSLGVEEQFYLVFPWLALLIAKRSTRTMLTTLGAATAASFALSLWWSGRYPTAAFYLLPPRAWELGVGVMLAALRLRNTIDASDTSHTERRLPAFPREALAILGFLALIVSVAAFTENTAFPGWAALCPVLGTAALIVSQGSLLNRRLLSARPMVFVGLVSYSWYLWHWPLMTLVRISSVPPPPQASLIGVAVASLALGCLSWRVIERPFRAAKLRPGPVLARYGVMMAGVLAVAILAVLGGGWPRRVPFEASAIERSVAAERHYPCLAYWDATRPDTSARCVRPGAPVVALIGDSHAGALGPAVQRMAANEGWGSKVFTKASCRPLVGVTVWRREQTSLPGRCAAFMTAAFDDVLGDPAVKTVLLAAWWTGVFDDPDDERYVDASDSGEARDGFSLLRQGLLDAIRRLQSGGKHVVFVGDTPHWDFDPARAALTRAIPVRRVVAAWTGGEVTTTGAGSAVVHDAYRAMDTRLAELSRAAGAQYVDLFRRFCQGHDCVFERGGDLLYTDDSHLSGAGADFALEGFSLAATKSASAAAPPPE